MAGTSYNLDFTVVVLMAYNKVARSRSKIG